MVDDLHNIHHATFDEQIPQEDFSQFMAAPFSYDSFSDVMPIDMSHLGKPPVLDEVETDYHFEVTLPGESSGRSSWVYSSTLKKVFIKISTPFTVSISYKNSVSELIQQAGNLNLRIIPVFTDPEDQHLPVNRCKHHQNEENPHILACKNQSAQHDGMKDQTNYGQRLCALIPLSSIAPEVTENITLEFYCQNSCATGINRRTTALIFSLETAMQEIIGKRLMYFKVCSCPKRDKSKEEQQFSETQSGGMPCKRRADDQLAPGNGKRPCKIIVKQEIKTEPSPPSQMPYDAAMPMTPMSLSQSPPGPCMFPGFAVTITMPNAEAMLNVLQTAANHISGMCDDSNDEQTRQHLQKYRQVIIQMKGQIEEQHQQRQGFNLLQ